MDMTVKLTGSQDKGIARNSRAALLLLALLCPAAWGQTAITGTFRYPDANPVNGKVEISLQRVAVKNLCTTPVSVLRFPPVVRRITNGAMAALSLYATSCLTPHDPYIVRVFDSNNTLLYQSRWTVPNQASANVIELDTR